MLRKERIATSSALIIQCIHADVSVLLKTRSLVSQAIIYLSCETIITIVHERVANRPKTNDIFAVPHTTHNKFNILAICS